MQLTDHLTENFTLGEMLRSGTADGWLKVAKKAGISKELKDSLMAKYNAQYQPTDTIIESLTQLCKNTLQPIAEKCDELYGAESYIRVNSGFRSKPVNDAQPGASKTSQHMQGEAADIDLIVDGEERNDLLVSAIKLMQAEGTLKFDQLILEFGASALNPGWVHISYDVTRSRQSVLRKVTGQPYVTYNLFK